ncbi:MAG: pumilio domain member 6 [Geoglossum umbratile]|nr:MAG: pumilio domain member 6 [Geoglossum umbratile]
MAGIKRKDSTEGQRGKVKRTKLEGSLAPKTSKKHARKAVEPDETGIVDDTFDGFGNEDETLGNGLDTGARTSAISSVAGATNPRPAANTPNNSSKSKEAHEKQKILAQERKAAKPNADLIHRSKKIWERLRRKSHVPPDERNELVLELFGIVTGRVKDFVFKHDSVRVVQTALKYANQDQRKAIAKELEGSFKQLGESKYAKFLISKLLVHGDAEIRDLIVPEFYGHVCRLIKHPEASQILDDIYRGNLATSNQKAILLREWYGPEFAIFGVDDQDNVRSTLSDILETSPEKRSPIMRSLFELIKHLTQKNMSGFTMLHDAMLEYFTNARQGSEEMTEFIELLKSDDDGNLLKNLAFTRSGARVVSLALAHGTAKDRKQILRAYKDYIAAIAGDLHGHKVILAAYEVIDDTVAVSKTVFPELLGKADQLSAQLVEYAVHPTARIPLLYLPAGRAKWLLPSDDLALLEEIDARRVTTSKKDSTLRRQELLKAITKPLLQVVVQNVETLAQSSFGCRFIYEVLLGCDGEKAEALEAVASAAEGDPSVDGHVAGSAAGGRMMKVLVMGGYYNAKSGKVDAISPPLGFHNLLYERIKPYLLFWATGPSSFVVVGLLEAEGFKKKGEVLKTLKSHQKQLENAASGKAVEREVEKEGKPEKRESKDGRNSAVGNAGSKLLLKMLT